MSATLHAAAAKAVGVPGRGARRLAICVATFRRPHMLERLLAGIAALDRPDACELEVRIVDNDANGTGRSTVDAFVASGCPDDVRVRYAIEPARSISAARNRGLEFGPADLIAFVDDDEVPEPDWLVSLVSRLDGDGCDAVFGSVRPRYPDGAPRWLQLGRFMWKGIVPDGRELGWEQSRTSNALVRGVWFYERGLRFDDRFGRSGAEDTDLFRRLQGGGGRLGSASRAVVEEEIQLAQCRFAWLAKRYWRGGINYERLLKLEGRGSHPLLRFGKRLVKGTGRLGLGLLVGVVARRADVLVAGALDLVRAGGGLVGWLAPQCIARSTGYDSSGTIDATSVTPQGGSS